MRLGYLWGYLEVVSACLALSRLGSSDGWLVLEMRNAGKPVGKGLSGVLRGSG